MKRILFACMFLPTLAFATLTPGVIPVDLTGGSNPSLQNGSLTDTGSSSGAGNVGVGTTNPGKQLDVNGTTRSGFFVETSIPTTVSTGGNTIACFSSSGQLISVSGHC